MSQPEILIVDDDPFQREMLSNFFEQKMQMKSAQAEHGAAALAYLKDHHDVIRVVMMDMQMPVMDGLTAMKIIKEKYPHIAVIFLTANRDIEIAQVVMELGAFDYLTKPFDQVRLILTFRNAFKYAGFSLRAGQVRWSRNGTLVFADLIGYDGGLVDVIDTARKIANSDIPVLIGGETGTGKEVIARAIHGESWRKNAPFVAINCGAIPEHLIESILFGHEKGAFTGATEKTPGKFREAEGGTIFLDEIGEMPMNAQIRLLRVLQQHEVQPVGGAKPVPINVRVISATNKDLLRMVQTGRFREDLFFRLNVVPLTLPPLRLRSEDILPLARHFIERCAEGEHLRRRSLSKEAEDVLVAYAWPGNVRELENTMRRALVLASGDILQSTDFTFDLSGLMVESGRTETDPANVPDLTRSQMLVSIVDEAGHVRPFQEIEREILDRSHRYLDGNIFNLAKSLKIARTTLYRKLNAEE